MADENKPAFYPRVGNITPRPRAPLAQTEVREQPLDPIMRTFKDLMDRSSALLDKSKVTPYDVTKGLISAIPFQGERFAKDFEQSTMPVPTGFGLLPTASPEGLDTSGMGMQSVRVPTKEALDQMKWSDLVGTAGASRMFEALGQNRTPEFFDTLDAATLGLAGLSAARAAPKVAKAVGEGAKTVGMGGLEMVNRGMFGEGPLAPFVPQHQFAVSPKKGGVNISSNPDTMMMELGNKEAKPPKIPPPIKFPVTRGPSVPEIRAMAERMAPQVMGEFVRAAPTPSNPKPSTSVVGKTQKQFEREKTLPIEYENIKDPVTPEEFDYAKKKGALLIGAQGDVTPGNRMLVSIDEQPLSAPVHLQAGPEWELYNPSAWAATDQMAKTWMNRAGKAAEAYEADPYLHYHKMTPDANWYAMHHFNSILGHLRPEELKLRDPKLYQQMLEEIRTKDVGFGKHPEFEGFDDPLNLQIHAQMDPNFRRHIGAIFGGPKFTQRYGLNSGQDVLAATSLPELRDLEAGAGGYAVVPLDVKAPLKHFEADSQTYDTGFPKAGASGRSKYPMPYQLMYRDTLNWMKDVPSENKSSEFGRMNMIVPKQQIDDELIDAIGEYQRRMKELTGKKKGGAVHKAEGGDITGDDLIIEERPL